MLPSWSKELSVHNEAIDEQHKKLFEIAGRAYALTNKKATKEEIITILRELLNYTQEQKEEIITILRELLNYTQEHFKDEEAYMESIYYPRLIQHKERHREIIRDMTSAVMQIRNVDDLKEQLAVIAKKWLLEHIIREDMQIEKFRRSTCQITPQETKVKNIVEESKVQYTCNCQGKVHLVPLELHNKIQKENVIFNCKTCKGRIKLLEQ